MSKLEEVTAALEVSFAYMGRVFDEGQAEWLAEAAIEALMGPNKRMIKDASPYKDIAAPIFKTMLQAVLDEK